MALHHAEKGTQKRLGANVLLTKRMMKMTCHSQGIPYYNKTCVYLFILSFYLFRDTVNGQLFDDEYWGKIPKAQKGERDTTNDMKVMFKYKLENVSDNKGDVGYLDSQK